MKRIRFDLFKSLVCLLALCAWVAAVATVTGCKLTPEDRQPLCTTAQAKYSGYLALVNAGVVPDDRKIPDAAAAAASLLLNCEGWEPAKPPPGTRVGSWTSVDRYGVRKLVQKSRSGAGQTHQNPLISQWLGYTTCSKPSNLKAASVAGSEEC